MSLFTLKSLIDIINVSLILFGVFYIYAKFRLSYWKRRGVPSVPANFIFGNLKDALFLKSSPSEIFGELHKYAGSDSPYIGFYVFHRPCLLIRNPELIKNILVKDFETFSDRHFAKHVIKDLLVAENLFSLKQPKWKYVRSKLSPTLTSGKLKKMVPLMLENAREMMKFINNQPNDKSSMKAIKMKDTASKYTTDIIASLAFGIKSNSFDIPEQDFRMHTAGLGKKTLLGTLNLFLIFFFSEFSGLTNRTLLGDSTAFYRKIFWSSIETREKSGFTRGDLIDSLIELKNSEQHSEFKFIGDSLLAHSAIFFVAGLDTSSTTIAFGLFELAKEPELQERARREVQDKFEEHGVTVEAFQEMKYLNQVISETLRIHPPAPILDRLASRDYKIPNTDVVIEKGTPVYVSLNGLHFDPQYHPDPLKFDPDRFSDERKRLMPPMTYMPFGEGPRICIGQRIGLFQVIIGMAMVLSEYEITIDPNKETTVDPKGIFLSIKNDINLLLKRIGHEK